MNALRNCAITLLAACCILAGCGDSQKAKQEAGPDERDAVIARLQSELSEARDLLAGKESENRELAAEAEALKRKVNETEAAAKAPTTERETAKKGSPGAEGPEDASRVGLMGAKALAEYKAARLAQRIETVTKDLERKEKELELIRQAASTKDSEIARLRKTTEEFKETDKARTAELNVKFENIRQELDKRALEAERLRKDLDDKTGLLETLKAAVGDATKLKLAAEAEVARLQAALDQNTKSLQEWQTHSQKLQQQFEQLHAFAEQTGQEKEHYRAEAETLGQELQRQYSAVQMLAAQVAELTSRLQQATASTAQAAAGDEPSAVDLLLQVPMKGAESEPASKLY